MPSCSRPLAVYALTAGGAATARRLAAALPEARLFLPVRMADGGFDRLAAALAENWRSFSGHVVVAAAGIVVRAVAPLLRRKDVDPAVVVVDEAGRFAVSLLSGHLGGANDLARQAAEALGGQAVITTATDSAGKPSLDVLARDRGCKLENLSALSRIGRLVLEDEPVGVFDPDRRLAPALAPWPNAFFLVEKAPAHDDCRPLVWVGPEDLPFPGEWLLVRPPCLFLGLGCNRGTDAAEMLDLVRVALKKFGLSPASVAGLASVDIKQDEPGLLALAEILNLPLTFFTSRELSAVEVPNPSAAAEKHIGVKSVCEAAALLASGRGRLLIPKQKSKNATLAAGCSR
ncbi:MAG: cobalamin biosynthesis protein [Pseudomonadota bacterium]